jgi:diguanylate cyclase (GGDEF)-like protein
MTDRGTELSGPLSRAIFTAPVAADLRALFARLPPGGEVVATLPRSAEEVPPAARQLIKLASLGGALRVARVDVAHEGERLMVTVRFRDRTLSLSAKDFESDLRVVCARILDTLYEAPSLARTLEAFAAESATLSTLSTLTSQMLRAPDLDHALYAMLSGVTSGFGLAFHRAALFVLDPQAGAFSGSKAIGPADEEEAHRIWEEMEFEDKELSQIVLDYTRGNVDNRFETFVRSLVLHEGRSEGDEVAAALASNAPVLFERGVAKNESLRALTPAREFVLAAIAPRAGENVRALLFADDAWSARPIARDRLARLHRFLDELTLVWENLALLARVEKLARVDALTGLYNRRVFEERLNDEQSRARRSGSPLTVLVLDIDCFKSINDTRGHAAGDEALRELAALFGRALREHDTVARIGGDEFAVILPGVAREEALSVATRIGALAKAAGLSLSIGGASVPNDTVDPGSVLAMADANLYAAKRAGRGRARMGGGVGAEF